MRALKVADVVHAVPRAERVVAALILGTSEVAELLALCGVGVPRASLDGIAGCHIAGSDFASHAAELKAVVPVANSCNSCALRRHALHDACRCAEAALRVPDAERIGVAGSSGHIGRAALANTFGARDESIRVRRCNPQADR